MLDAKIHINRTISDAKKSARHLGLDIKNYYLGTPMDYFQYMRVHPSYIPQEVWDDPSYDIHIADDGYVYLEIRRGMYGLKEAGIIAFNQLVSKSSHLTDTNPCPSPQASGTIAPNAPLSFYASTTLASSTSPKPMPNISLMPSAPITN
jgi:hypothetical protein